MRADRRQIALGLSCAVVGFHPTMAATPKAAPLTAAELAMVDRAGVYLQALREVRGRFVQTDARGGVAKGDLYLKRPGRARFEYDAPSRLLVVADGNYVTVANPQLKTFDRYPLMATPLSIFLARQIRLDRRVVVTQVSADPTGFSITAVDSRHEAEGRISLRFTDAPMMLKGWTVIDAQGQAVSIAISDLTQPTGLPESLFRVADPRPKSPGRAKQ